MQSYQSNSTMNQNEWISDPTVSDPDNLPIPLGWTVQLRPYGISSVSAGGIILDHGIIDFMNYTLNIGRVVAIGESCWNRPEHKNKDGERYEWCKIGDFVSYPRNTGAKRKFKGVSFIMVTDDEVLEILRDPLVFDNSSYKLNIPEEDLKKYNTIYNPSFTNGGTNE